MIKISLNLGIAWTIIEAVANTEPLQLDTYRRRHSRFSVGATAAYILHTSLGTGAQIPYLGYLAQTLMPVTIHHSVRYSVPHGQFPARISPDLIQPANFGTLT